MPTAVQPNDGRHTSNANRGSVHILLSRTGRNHGNWSEPVTILAKVEHIATVDLTDTVIAYDKMWIVARSNNARVKCDNEGDEHRETGQGASRHNE